MAFKLNKSINPVHGVEEQLKNNCLKIFSDKNIRCGNYNSINLILKISGIWETKNEYGITFKIIILNKFTCQPSLLIVNIKPLV